MFGNTKRPSMHFADRRINVNSREVSSDLYTSSANWQQASKLTYYPTEHTEHVTSTIAWSDCAIQGYIILIIMFTEPTNTWIHPRLMNGNRRKKVKIKMKANKLDKPNKRLQSQGHVKRGLQLYKKVYIIIIIIISKFNAYCLHSCREHATLILLHFPIRCDLASRSLKRAWADRASF